MRLSPLLLCALGTLAGAQRSRVALPGVDGSPIPQAGPALPLPPQGFAYTPDTVSFAEAQPVQPLSPNVSRGPVTGYSLAVGQSLPDGLVLDPETGIVSGTPTTLLPPTPFDVLASNAGGTSMTTLTIEVFGVAPDALAYNPAGLEVELRSGPYYIEPVVGGGPVDSYSIVPPLPLGLVLDAETGTISGLPRLIAAPTTHTITATNETGSTTADFQVEVSLPAPPQGLSYTPGGPYTFTLGEPIAPVVPSVSGRVDSYAVLPQLPNDVLIVSGGNALPRNGVLLPDNPTPILFAPPEQTIHHPWQRLNVWLPAGTPPATGWPVLVSNPNAAYFGSPPLDAIDPSDVIELFFHKALNAGIAVVFFGTIDPGPITGWFYPPGHPSGRWEDLDHLMPEKDVLHAIQWTKFQSSYPLDPNRIFLHGSSAGATTAAWVALGPDLAIDFGSPQRQVSSRVAGVLCFDTLFSFPAYAGEDTLVAHHWESTSLPGTSAVDMADTDPALLDAGSVGRILLDPLCYGATTPVFLAYDCAGASVDFRNDPDEFPSLRNVIGTNVHDLWHGAKFWERLIYLNRQFHQLRSEFYVAAPYVSQLGGVAGAETGTFTGLVINSTSLYDDAVAWVATRARDTIFDPNGLQLHPKSGRIHGTPNRLEPPRIYQIRATNPGGFSQTGLNIQVEAPAARVAPQR